MITVYNKKNIIYLLLIFLFTVTAFAQDQEDKFELDEIIFTGNNIFSNDFLKDIVSSKETPWGIVKFIKKYTPFGKGPSYFDSLKVISDIKSLKSFYNINGFLNLKASYRYSVDTANKTVKLYFEIYEGKPYILNKIEFIGLESFPNDLKKSFDKEITVDTGKRYSRDYINMKKNQIMNFLINNGYMLSEPNSPNIYVDTVLKSIFAKISFKTGKRYTINNINIDKTGVGKDLVEESLIKEIIAINNGDWYNAEQIRKSQVRLHRTNIFSTALISGQVTDTIGNKVPLKVIAEIGKLHELSPEVILNNKQNTFNVGLAANFQKKNFTGKARKLTTGVSFGIQDIFRIDNSQFNKLFSATDTTTLGFYEARFSIDQPYVFSKPIFGKWDFYMQLNKKAENNDNILGTKISFDFEMPSHTFINSLESYFNFESIESIYKQTTLMAKFRSKVDTSVYNHLSSQFLSSLFSSVKSRTNNSYTSVLGTEFGSNKIDDAIFPRSGYYITALLEDANLISYGLSKILNYSFNEPLFFKVLISSASYLPMYRSNSSSFGIKFKIGNISTYKGVQAKIPPTRLFFAGGSNSVRGWQSQQLKSPSISKANIDTNDINLYEILKDNTIGGTFLIESTIESRHKLFGDAGAALFADIGNTWNGYKNFNYNELGVTLGFGLRYYSPFAPIRIDFGFKVYNPDTKKSIFNRNINIMNVLKFREDILVFHFGIGEAF